MDWENIIKVGNMDLYRDTLDETISELKSLVKDKDFKVDDLEHKLHHIYNIRLFRSIMEHIDNPDDFPLEKYVQHYGVGLNRMFQLIISETVYLRKEYAKNRSMELLEDMAKTFGVELKESRTTEVIFTHGGLDFQLHRGGVYISLPAITGFKIGVCVVDEKHLPIGDFYASMLGLIVARPEELDVVNFGIQLGQILMKYKALSIDIVKSLNPIDRALFLVGIFTPFSSDNVENDPFKALLARANLFAGRLEIAQDLLQEIDDALIDCFGSTRGF